MDTSYLYTKTTAQLKLIAKQAGVKLPAGAPKAKIIALIAESYEKKTDSAETETAASAENEPAKTTENQEDATAKKKRGRKKAAVEEGVSEEAPQSAEAPSVKRRRGRPPKNRATEAQAPANDNSVSEAPDTSAADGNSEEETTALPTIDIKETTSEVPQATQAAKSELSGAANQADALSVEETNFTEPKDENEAASEPTDDAKPAENETETIGEGEKPVPAFEWGEGHGVLEILPDGYGFLRAENCLPGPKDVYLSQTQIRRFNLRNGDYITGRTRPQRDGDRYEGMIYVSTVNGSTADAARRRPRFEDLTPIFPNSRLRLENPLGDTDLALRTIDLIAPIGKGQRGLIVSPPKAGKTVLLKLIANAITANYPDVELMVLLIDERPEEVTDMQRSTKGEVLYSTFDEAPENHTRLSEMVLDKAQRQVEMGKDVVILLDSITRLARAYNLVIPPTGRSLSGGLDPGALLKPKKFFGAARNIEFGGSLTIIATALVDTGSRLDDIIYEEFKGTGNMELHLDRKLSERRVFPAIDINRSGTRRDDLLYTPQEAAGALQLRRALAGGSTQDATEQLMSLMEKTQNNEQLSARIKGWMAAIGK